MALCASNLPNNNNNDNNNNVIGSRKVRLIAKIRGFSDREAEFPTGSSWISVNKPNGDASKPVTVTFGDLSASRKDSYEVDYCYEQSEDNELIFSREVKPLISGVFDGCNATVIAYGARGSGKTSLTQGSTEKPGLAALAIAEILSLAEDTGKSVTISFYEVYQDRVCDLLDSKQQAVPLKSISDFQKLYVEFGLRKPTQKAVTELSRKGHKGLIVHISATNEKLDTLAASKMNFVDLAGYEDVRRKSSESLNVVEQTKVNKSIYALLNVIHALSVNERHVPYRESKMARILQDSLGGVNKVLMVACLNPTFCLDSINMVNLASRSCQKINRSVIDSTKKVHSLIRPMTISSKKSQLPRTVSAIAKKQASSRVPLSEKKLNVGTSFKVKGRKLFGEAGDFTPSNKASSMLKNVSPVETIVKEEGKPAEHVTDITVPSEEGNALPIVLKHTEPTSIVEKDHLSSESHNAQVFCLKTDETTHEPQNSQFTPTVGKASEYGENHPEDATPYVDVNIDTKSLSFAPEGQNIANDNINSLVVDDNSPPISLRLRELSNSLKALCSATPTPFCLKTAEKDASSHALVSTDVLEPKTPVTERSTMMEDKWNVKNVNSPWGTFSARSTGMKNSLVHEYLRFLNTADKKDLKKLKGIGEKRAIYILKMREESPEPFKNLDDLKHIGLSGKQVKALMKKEVGGLFD
ncbi:Kinesin-like protein KIF22 [Morus notabilis]|uniref:Kinesin-like protein KIF22 n=1 Tax=Morus notabilis TaxID=981085 RepID=W9SNP1_9ROSA|nr:Kinesin-like protein KIF22 [Morus notabilis]